MTLTDLHKQTWPLFSEDELRKPTQMIVWTNVILFLKVGEV